MRSGEEARDTGLDGKLQREPFAKLRWFMMAASSYAKLDFRHVRNRQGIFSDELAAKARGSDVAVVLDR
jgi:hypothetical protein